MKAEPGDLTVSEILELKNQQMLVVNPEYQRGVVWNTSQKRKLVDSVLRGYPIPLLYLHHIRQSAGKLVSERYEVIDGQQRINALSEFHEGAFKLFDPVRDEAVARFPSFIKKQPCPWGGKAFQEITDDLKEQYLTVPLRVVRIETHDSNEARDLFIRLQAGMPLTSQEKRDAWPGQFTDFILRLGGKTGLARYPGHDFFNLLMGAQRVKDRGKFRQLAAQIAMLFLSRRSTADVRFRDTNAQAIDDFYYENLGFDSSGPEAQRLDYVLTKITDLLRSKKRPKIIGHEAIHLVLLVDSLLDDYTPSWEETFAEAFDDFRAHFAEGKLGRDGPNPSDYWLRYGVWTRVNSDRGEAIQRRHEFFVGKMRAFLRPKLKDPQRSFGSLERELVYYRDSKKCAVCDTVIDWAEVEIHHVEQHSKGGRTVLANAALVHRQCHPKGAAADSFAKTWKARSRSVQSSAQAPNTEDEVEWDDVESDSTG